MKPEAIRLLEAAAIGRYNEDAEFHAKVKTVENVMRSCLPDAVVEKHFGSILLAALASVGALEDSFPPVYRDTRRVCVFRMDGEPVSKERPRVGRGGTYTPERTKAYEERVGWAARAVLRGPRLSPLKFYRVKVTLALAGKWDKDVDNMCKSILDGMNGVVYPDDKQVVILDAVKTSVPSRPYATVEVWEVEPIELSVD